MTILILVAFLNGGLIAASRSINARLGMSIGALRSSFWNHLGGLILLTVLLTAAGLPDPDRALGAPPAAYCGGVLGALFVAINSRVLPRLGALTTLTLIIGGQMAAGLAIEYPIWGMPLDPLRIAAVMLIILGAALARGGIMRATRCNGGLIRCETGKIRRLVETRESDAKPVGRTTVPQETRPP
ncbi:DMT family transporter [Mesorhizobium sp. L-8-3]|uniref:DMT family transporter n=1 Tax=Mesorhizobium sp. L-8-3 TaxID=2744522 RepID=UPI00192785F8|nr:DMT family transporter [Mesorhizobium sp. L-8-3]BCH22279.1 hypothetical protein MesoLjLb_20640 [Mesorhizobium sp. L-8-3]